MAWVRIHDGAMTNPKIQALSDSAFRLWVRALCYCQIELTDGLLPREAIRTLKAKRKDVDALTTAIDPAYAPLWEVHDIGFKVHDYLFWNDSREKVRDRQQKGKDRLEEWKRKRDEKRVSERVTECVRNGVVNGVRNGVVNAALTKPNLTKPQEEREKSASLSPPADPFVDPTTTTRAGAFVDRYATLYPKHRKGARYAVNPTRDYAAAVRLCATWPDDARLDKLAVIFLTTDHKFAEEGSRTIPQFGALASWCDGKLAEHEAKRSAL